MTSVLPAVAKNFYTFCKKCDADRYHVVLAHTSSTAAKIKCEVCGSQKSYSIKSSATGTRKGPGIARETARRSSHNAEYEMLMQKSGDSPAQSYNMKGRFEANQKLQHPKFGLGIIRAAQSDKIDVVFSDEIRSLIHNRP